jgi:hypothetical protein
VVVAWLRKHWNSRRGRSNAAALREAEGEVEVLGDDSSRLGAVLGVQEEEEVAAVPFPYLAWRGDVQRLGSDSFFRRRPWLRGGRSRERRRGKTAAGRARVRVRGLAVQII